MLVVGVAIVGSLNLEVDVVREMSGRDEWRDCKCVN